VGERRVPQPCANHPWRRCSNGPQAHLGVESQVVIVAEADALRASLPGRLDDTGPRLELLHDHYYDSGELCQHDSGNLMPFRFCFQWVGPQATLTAGGLTNYDNNDPPGGATHFPVLGSVVGTSRHVLHHPGVVIVTFCDGHTETIADNANCTDYDCTAVP